MNGREDESLIVHEYGHVYFYGILANNELDEAWLDEGFTTYQTTEYMMQKYGDHGFDPKLYSGYDKFPKKFWPKQNELQSDQWSAIRFQSSGHNENISKPSYLFNSGSSYSRNAYTKPALMLSELKYFLEDSLFYTVMQSYFDQWQFKHTNEKRFIETVEKVVGQNMGWFFNPWLHTTRDLDYGIKSFEKSYDKNFWNINLEIENKGSRFLPIKIETLFSDGTKENRWWTNHLWRFDDTLSYRVNKKPIKITLDPDVQTMDLDFRNNTTRMNKKIIFNWPGLDYSPRDEIVYKWNPNFYFYKPSKDFSPGFYIEKNYGFYEKTFMSINYSMKSKNIYWDFNSSRQLVHYFPRTKFNFWTFNKPGVLEYGGELEKKWNKVYGSTPTQTYSIGFYLQPKYDGLRSQALGYDELHSKRLGIGYLGFSTTIGVSSLEINSATSLGALSDWNFNRFTFESYTTFSKVLSRHNKTKPDKNKIKLNLKNRFIVGKIWSDKAGAPSQEAFNIEGNSSNEQLRKRYIVDQFYGNTNLFNHYHLSGDGNLRGFTGMSLENADALVSTSNELGFFTTMPKINLSTEIIAFADGGVFLNEGPSKKRYLGDAGFGVRFDTSFFEKDIYIRLDFPFIIYDDNSLSLDWNNWIFSFQRSI